MCLIFPTLPEAEMYSSTVFNSFKDFVQCFVLLRDTQIGIEFKKSQIYIKILYCLITNFLTGYMWKVFLRRLKGREENMGDTNNFQ